MSTADSPGTFKIAAVALLLLAVVGVVDYLTGIRLHFFLFYFIPIAYVAWKVGKSPAVVMAIIAAVTWTLLDVLLVFTGDPWPVDAWNVVIRLVAFLVVALAIGEVRDVLARERKINQELSAALETIKELSGIIPMCTFCRKIRDEQNNWVPLERYIADHTSAQVSHGMCEACYRRNYGDPDGT